MRDVTTGIVRHLVSGIHWLVREEPQVIVKKTEDNYDDVVH